MVVPTARVIQALGLTVWKRTSRRLGSIQIQWNHTSPKPTLASVVEVPLEAKLPLSPSLSQEGKLSALLTSALGGNGQKCEKPADSLSSITGVKN